MQRAPIFVLVVALTVAVVGCGAASDDAQGTSSRAKKKQVQVDSPELDKIDGQLASLNEKSADLRGKLDGIQGKVAARIGPDEDEALRSYRLDGTQLFIELDERSAILVNGIGMNRNEFDKFAETRGKSICAPTPIVKAHPDSKNDILFELVERIYAEGCGEVDLQ